MATRIVVFYRQPSGGWTETWYSSSAVPAAIPTQDSNALSAGIKFRDRLTELYGVRYSAVGNNLPSRFFRLGGITWQGSFTSDDGPDVDSTAAEWQMSSSGGQRKMMWLRGLNDSDIRRNPAQGFDTPSGRLRDAIQSYIIEANSAGWQIQAYDSPRNGGLQGNPVVSVHPGTLNTTQAIVELQNDPTGVTPVGTNCRVTGVPYDQLPGFPKQFKVLAINGVAKTVTIPYNVRNQGTVTPTIMKLFPAVPHYYSIDIASIEFIREAEHRTGRPIGLLAGRQRVKIRRF